MNDFVISEEEMERNRRESIKRDELLMLKKQLKKKHELKLNIIITTVVCIASLVVAGTMLSSLDNNNYERVASKCEVAGTTLTEYYTSTGDVYYRCIDEN